jgi:hypothetical protein
VTAAAQGAEVVVAQGAEMAVAEGKAEKTRRRDDLGETFLTCFDINILFHLFSTLLVGDNGSNIIVIIS